jgi:hypothetical protein
MRTAAISLILLALAAGTSEAQGRYGDQRYRDRDYRSTRAYNSVPYDNGYRDGLEKGREDANDRDSFDPVRHSWYRSANRGYNNRYGSKDSYKLTYRDGFEAGYQQAYRQVRGNGTTSRGYRVPRY